MIFSHTKYCRKIFWCVWTSIVLILKPRFNPTFNTEVIFKDLKFLATANTKSKLIIHFWLLFRQQGSKWKLAAHHSLTTTTPTPYQLSQWVSRKALQKSIAIWETIHLQWQQQPQSMSDLIYSLLILLLNYVLTWPKNGNWSSWIAFEVGGLNILLVMQRFHDGSTRFH